MLDGARIDDGAWIGLLLPQHLDRLLHLRHPIHHLDLELLILVDAFSQLLSSLLSLLSIRGNLLSILDSLSLHLHQLSLTCKMDVNPKCT